MKNTTLTLSAATLILSSCSFTVALQEDPVRHESVLAAPTKGGKAILPLSTASENDVSQGKIDVEVVLSHLAESLGDIEVTVKAFDDATRSDVSVFEREALPYSVLESIDVPTIRHKKIRLSKDRVTFSVLINGEEKGWFRVYLTEHNSIHIAIDDDYVSFSADRELTKLG